VGFYRRVTATIRSADAHQVIFPEGIADSGMQPPVLPRLADPQVAFNFHFYCSATQGNTAEVPVGSPSSAAQTCAPIEQTQLSRFTSYANRLGVPGFMSEFSCDDVNPDNAQIVDLMAHTFTSWTAWAYYNGAADPADCSTQGLLINDQLPGSEANARQDKLNALAVPYAEAIAGIPVRTSLDRARRVYRLAYRSDAVPGTRLRATAQTVVFVPARMYRHGYAVIARGARVRSRPNARWLRLAAVPKARVFVSITPRN
jgi:endoglycosylceramidase